MRHLRVASSTIRLGAAGAVLAVLAVLTPAAAFAGSGDAAPGDDSAATAQTVPPAGLSTDAATSPAGSESPEPGTEDSSETDAGDGAETGPEASPETDSTESAAADDEATATPTEAEPVTPAAGADQPTRPTAAQATTDPVGEPSVKLEQYEQLDGEWQPSDGSVDFGNEIRYVFRVVVPAGQTLPAAQLRSYVPGWDQANDQVTNVPARLVAGSAHCSPECDVEANQNNGLVTWSFGSLAAGNEDLEVTAEFTVRFGDLPLDAQFDSSGMFFARAWCRGELAWSQPAARLAAGNAPTTGQASAGPVFSNAVTATAMALEAIIGTPVTYPTAPGISATAGPTHGPHSANGATVLPNTGGPQAALAVAGAALVALGGLTVTRARRRD